MRRLNYTKTLGVNFVSGKKPGEVGNYQFWSVMPEGEKGWTFRARIHDGPRKRLRELMESPLNGIKDDWFLASATSIDVFAWLAEHYSTDVPERHSMFRVQRLAKQQFPEQYAEMVS